MITLQIGKGVHCYGLPEKIKEQIFKDLTFDNPKYLSAQRHGSYVSANTPRYLRFFATTMDKDLVWFPRGYLWYVKRSLKLKGYKVKVDDRTISFKPLNLKFHGKLRPYQDEAVGEMVCRYPQGVLEAATGAGKTVMGAAIIAERQQPTLILVHNKELLYQWQGAIKKFLRYDCGLVGDKHFNLKPITVSIINTVRNRIEDLRYRFGHIIVDECHRCPSTTWTETLTEFPARYYLGLSATPFRSDGLGKAIYCHIGAKIHEVDKNELQETGAVLKPRIVLVKTSFQAARSAFDEERMAYSKIIKKLVEDKYRNTLITDTVCNDLKRHNENTLIVSDRVSHCQKLADMLLKRGIKAHVLSGKVKTDERARIVADVKAGRCKVLIATISLIGEGFDAPNLTALHLPTPIKFSGRLIQTVGRVLRPEKGKVPRVFDYRDENVRVLRNSGWSRNNVYKKQWN